LLAEDNNATARGGVHPLADKDPDWIDARLASDFLRHDPGPPVEVRGYADVRWVKKVGTRAVACDEATIPKRTRRRRKCS
jgi:hypothetical protein